MKLAIAARSPRFVASPHERSKVSSAFLSASVHCANAGAAANAISNAAIVKLFMLPRESGGPTGLDAVRYHGDMRHAIYRSTQVKNCKNDDRQNAHSDGSEVSIHVTLKRS